MIETILIDFDGVIRHWPEAHVARVESDFDLPPGTISVTAFATDLIERVIVGEISDPLWRGRVAERLGEAFPAVDCRAAVDAWSEPSGEIDIEMLEIIRACRASATVALVTNATSRLPMDLARLGLSDAFDHVVNSSEVGTTKPGSEIFEHALRVTGTTASAALFIDDKASNVAGAGKVGITSHLFESAAGLRAFLGEHGVG